jgi:hypothetical protein
MRVFAIKMADICHFLLKIYGRESERMHENMKKKDKLLEELANQELPAGALYPWEAPAPLPSMENLPETSDPAAPDGEAPLDSASQYGMPAEEAAPVEDWPEPSENMAPSPEFSVDSILPQELPVGVEQIREAAQTLRKYRQGKANLEKRVIENELWFRMRHWEQMRRKGSVPNDPEPASGWLFNSISNKHADAMDNFPEPSVLPREESDQEAAEALGSILPVVLERCGFEQTYSDTWWQKLKSGTGVYGVFWNPSLENGLGDIDIQQVDLLNIFWEPGIRDIQRSRNLFTVELVDNEILEEQYPQLKGALHSSSIDVGQYIYDDSVDTSEKSAVVDWYYKREGILHYCKFVNETVLYASENDPQMAETGWYGHGEYPFVFDKLFLEEGSPAGFGYVDVMKDCQMYIDRLNQALMRHAMMASKKRYFIRDTGSVNEQEFADWNRDFIHVSGSALGEDSIREVDIAPMDSLIPSLLSQKIDELKETSGNRDFSQGSTSGGVTAASAIAALQEAGSKLSRDMIKSSYRAFSRINYLCIELIRQFYTEPRCFRIVGDKGQQFLQVDNRPLQPQPQGNEFGLDLGQRLPVFDIQVTSQKASPFSKAAQNELAKELYTMGFFSPEMGEQAMAALDMMDFEGKELVRKNISQNLVMQQQLNQMQQQLAQLASMAVSSPEGIPPAEEAAGPAGGVSPQPAPAQGLGAAV